MKPHEHLEGTVTDQYETDEDNRPILCPACKRAVADRLRAVAHAMRCREDDYWGVALEDLADQLGIEQFTAYPDC